MISTAYSAVTNCIPGKLHRKKVLVNSIHTQFFHIMRLIKSMKVKVIVSSTTTKHITLKFITYFLKQHMVRLLTGIINLIFQCSERIFVILISSILSYLRHILGISKIKIRKLYQSYHEVYLCCLTLMNINIFKIVKLFISLL